MRQLTQAEVDGLPSGAIVEIKWSGGNGPHRYEVERHYSSACARMKPIGIDCPYRLEAISPVGDHPLTQVWLVSVPEDGR